MEEVEPSLADLMMGDALQNKAERAAKTAKEEKRMKKSFGDGMKKGLKKGFFDRKPSKPAAKPKPKPKPKEEEMPTITRSSKKEPGEVMQSMKEEIASSMAQDRHPLAGRAPGRRVGHARFDKGDGQAARAGEGHVEPEIPGAFRGVRIYLLV